MLPIFLASRPGLEVTSCNPFRLWLIHYVNAALAERRARPGCRAAAAARRSWPALDRLDTPVRWVHAIELTDVARLLRAASWCSAPGSRCPTTTGCWPRTSPSWPRAGVAGLAVELGRRYAGSLPGRAGRRGRGGRGLPLIAFEREVAFIEITEAVHARIIDAQLEELRASERLHEMFTELSVAGASAEEIVRQAAALAGRPVILADLSHRVLACEPAGPIPGRLLERLRRAEPGGPPARGRTVLRRGVGLAVHPGRRAGRGLGTGDPGLRRRRRPAPTRVLIERAATTLALGRLLTRHRESLERQAHRTLISGIITQAHADPAEAAVRSRALGVPVDGRQLIAMVLRLRDRRDRPGARSGFPPMRGCWTWPTRRPPRAGPSGSPRWSGRWMTPAPGPCSRSARGRSPMTC